LPLLLLLTLLAIYGLFVLYSASGQSLVRVQRQAVYLLIAFSGMFVVAQFRLKTIFAVSPFGYAFGLALLLGVALLGVEVNGSKRWLNVFGLLRFQPSEIMKMLVPLTVAAFLSRTLLPPSFYHLLIALALLLFPFGLILIQPDLGTSLLVVASGLIVVWLAGLRWRYIVGFLVLLAASAWPAWHYLLEGYQRQRILTLFNPETDKLGAGWNIIQSKTAIGSGGLEGKGWLNGTQSQLDFLPEGHTDFIIAVLAEEFGFLGVAALLGLYILIVLRGVWISQRARDTFSRLVAGSITFTFFIYMLVNMGMVSGMLPVVGIPLPLVSYGGTALVTMLASFGILMAISSEAKDN
jgi:rod shape determining protein RodA